MLYARPVGTDVGSELAAVSKSKLSLGRLSVARSMGFAAVGVPAAVYLATLMPGLGHSGDSAELSTCARFLAVPHATGYPLYVLSVHGLWRLLPVSPALAANLFSALSAVLALWVTWRLLAKLGVARPVALAATWTLAASPTFWEHAIVAEVYSLHLLLLALVALLFIRFAERKDDQSFYGACFVYALAFGNHLLMVTLLPAVCVLVLWVKPRAFLERRRVLAVAAIIALCSMQYGLLLARAADGAAPYRGAPINGLGDLLQFVTGATYRDQMFAFSGRALWLERLPRYIDTALHELAPMVFFVPLGIAALGRTPANAFLVLAFLGNLGFALSYDITDIQPYLMPNHMLGAVFLGVGLDRVLRNLSASAPQAARGLLALALASPLALGVLRAPRIVAESGHDAAVRAQALLADLRPGSIVIAEYPNYEFMLYYRLVEKRAPMGPFVAHEGIDLGDVVAYLRDGKPLWLPQLGISLPPGFELFSEKLFAPRRYEQAGLTIEPWRHDLYRIRYSVEPSR